LRLGLWLAATVVLIVLAVLAVTWWQVSASLTGHALFETLFWGPGHIWQFCLTTLMMLAWLGLCPPSLALPSARRLKLLLLLGATPALAAPLLLFLGPASTEYFAAFTRLMQWTSWEVPLFLGCLLLVLHRRSQMLPATGLALSVLLLVCGIVLGAIIDGQTTLVTAHYHGNQRHGLRGYVLLGASCSAPLQLRPPTTARRRPEARKMAGNVGVEFSVETVSRVRPRYRHPDVPLPGMRQLWPGVALRVARHG
jgi:hypothetical protein